MTPCHDVRDQLSLYIDELLDADDDAMVRAHLAICPACREVADDLVQLATAARLLGPIDPPAHVWTAVAERLREEQSRAVSRPMTWQWAALAASLLCVTLTGYFLIGTGSIDAPGATAPAVAGSIDAVTDELEIAAHHYERAIAELEALTPAEEHVDPLLASVVRDNINVLDRAIAESRDALTGDPTNETARASLFESLRRKVDLLQATALLIEDMRAEDPATTTSGLAGRQS